MEKLTISLFESALVHGNQDILTHLDKGGISLYVTVTEKPILSIIAKAEERFAIFIPNRIKGFYFNNSISPPMPQMIIMPECEYTRGRLMSEHYPAMIVFIISGESLEEERIDNFYVTNWSFIGEYINQKLRGNKKDGKSKTENIQILRKRD